MKICEKDLCEMENGSKLILQNHLQGLNEKPAKTYLPETHNFKVSKLAQRRCSDADNYQIAQTCNVTVE